jgi:oxygen-independent coproporphyrinogen-3 oxidase
VARLIADARAAFTPASDLEITLEANPTSIEAQRFRAYAAAGVNRVSIGVQALDAAALAFLGREHSAAQAVAAIALARESFPRLSFDLIYARPDQAEAAWRAELREALALAADHLSLYQLTIEQGTKFHTLHGRGAFTLPDEDVAAALYEATEEEAGQFGLRPYEISNFARPGGESRHNLTYWRYGEYAGIGPGAHGRVALPGGLTATSRHRAPEAWASLVEAKGSGETHTEILEPLARSREALLMGLRLAEGVSATHFAARTGVALAAAIDQAALSRFVEAGFMLDDGARLTATPAGRQRLDALLPALVL